MLCKLAVVTHNDGVYFFVYEYKKILYVLLKNLYQFIYSRIVYIRKQKKKIFEIKR